MIEDKKVRFAVLGYGHIGKRHAEMINRNTQCELVAVVDILPKEIVGFKNDNIPYFSTLESFLESNIVTDVVSIATPNGLHADHAIKCLEKGKHIVVEKPISLTTVDAYRIVAKAKETGGYVFPVMQNRYSPPAVWIKKVIERRLLGEIFVVQMNCFWNRDEKYYTKGSWHGTKDLDGGTLFTQFSHFIDMMYWLFGKIINVKSKFFNFNHQELIDFEDSGFVTFDLSRGGTGVFSYSTSVYDENFESSLTLIGEKGTAKIGGQYMNEVVYCNIKDYQMPELDKTDEANDYGAYKGSAANHHYVIENVVNVLKNNAQPDISIDDAVNVIEIIENIYKSDNKIITQN